MFVHYYVSTTLYSHDYVCITLTSFSNMTWIVKIVIQLKRIFKPAEFSFPNVLLHTIFYEMVQNSSKKSLR